MKVILFKFLKLYLDEYLVVTYQQKGVLRIYQIDELNDDLIKIYLVKNITEQLPFLPNQAVIDKLNDLV